jgi:hypothetical protein
MVHLGTVRNLSGNGVNQDFVQVSSTVHAHIEPKVAACFSIVPL